MKLPIEGMTSTVVSGVILTALFALIANIISGGWVIDIILILVIWIIIFALLVKPTPPRT